MDRPSDLIDDRWFLYRKARENGAPEAEAYDHYLHPRTRISDAELAKETMAVDLTGEGRVPGRR